MVIIITIVSIFAITGLMWFLNRIFPFKICPICAGVSGTWLLILVGIYGGWLEADGWKLMAALAMGGSIVGIAYQLEKKLPVGRSPLLWKALFIPAGFIAAYGILMQWWGVFLASLAFLFTLAFVFRAPPRNPSTHDVKVRELEKKMKNCC